MSPEDVAKIRQIIKSQLEFAQEIEENTPTRWDNLLAALDLLFQARYDWPQGTVKNMRLQDVYVALEHPNDWCVIPYCGRSGPSYRDPLDSESVHGKEPDVILTDSDGTVGVYKPDVRITLAFGLRAQDDFQEDWCTRFPDPRASVSHADILYNAALVFRAVHVSVDGGRAKLPLPKSRKDLTVPRGYAKFIEITDNMEGVSEYSRYFREAGLTPIDEPWY